MKTDIPAIYSKLYGDSEEGQQYRRTLLGWLYQNNTEAYMRVCQDHETTLEKEGLGWMK